MCVIEKVMDLKFVCFCGIEYLWVNVKVLELVIEIEYLI